MKDIENYEGLYAITEDGKLWSYRRKKFLRIQDNGIGYKICTLYKNGKATMYYIHRIVAQAFIPNPNNWPQINHKDENPANNRVENLEWCTQEYNNNYGSHREKLSIVAKNRKKKIC